MADDGTPKPTRIFRIVLVASLALNLAFLGVIGGAFARSKAGGGAPSGIELGVGPLGRALSEEDRREVARALRERTDFRRGDRAAPRRTMQEIQELLRQDELDTAALAAILERSSRRSTQLQAAAQDALVEHLSGMSVQDRIAFADRLEQTSRRRDGQRP